MSLRYKFVLVLGIVLAACLLLATFILRSLVYPTFDGLQESIADSNVERARMSLESLGEYIDATNRDWSQWNETVEFLNGQRPSFIEDNLYHLTFLDLDIDTILFFDASGKLVWGQMLDGEHGNIVSFDLDEVFDPPLTATNPLLRHESATSRRVGLLATSRGAMLVSSRPALNSVGAGPIRGTVIFGRILGAGRLDAMRKRAEVEFSLVPIRRAALDATDRAAGDQLLAATGRTQHRRNQGRFLSYAMLEDVYGTPSYLLRVQTDDRITAAGIDALQLAVTLLGLTALLFVASVWVMMQRVVVNPVSGLIHHILGIRESGNLSNRIGLERDDEIGALAEQFDTLTGELDQARREMAASRDAALEVARLKSEFLATMSHEIRTPMNGVMGMAELLLDTRLDDKQRRFAQTIQNSADSLLAIINDILDFSKLDAGKVELEQRDFALRNLLEEVTTLFAGAAHAKGLELLCKVPPNLDTVFRGDSNRLRQILANLIGNAIKFTKRGEVTVGVQVEAVEESRHRLRFSVRDTGIGISAADRERIFDSFSQADASTTREFGGTGLGLSICKQLVELMGGSIGVDGALGEGSIFWFEICLESCGVAPEVAAGASFVLHGARALIVDDNATNREILTHQLAAWEMPSLAVESGSAALAALRTPSTASDPFRVVLLDMYMPEMDGLRLAQEIHADPALSHIPMVMLSSVFRAGEAQEREQAGILAYLVKPVRQSELFECLSEVLGGASRAGAADAGDAALAGRAAREPTVRAARVLLVEDNAVNQEVALAMLQQLGHTADLAADGRAALAAIAEKDYDLVLMDCQMPVLDGYAATAEIRRREAAQAAGRRLPVIALTANAIEGDRERCLAADMDDYLSKPFRQRDLAAAIERWAGAPEPGAAPALPTPKTESADGDAAGPAVDPTALDEIRALQSAARPTLLADVISAYWRSSRELLEDLAAAIEESDAEAVRQVAHALKSSSRNLGARDLGDLCEALEKMGRSGVLGGAKDDYARLAREYARVCIALEREAPIKPD